MADRQNIINLKSQLDGLRLPSQFAPEDAPLLTKLVARLQQAEGEPFSPRKDWRTDETQEHSRQFSQAQQALNMEVAHLFQENNQLRREAWTARQATEELRIAIMSKWASKMEQSGGKLQQQFRTFIERGRREQQLASELQQVRYKYNELMDLIHQDPPLQREYLRRLLKRKKQPNIAKSTSNLHADSRIVEGHNKESVEGSSEISILKGRLIVREEEILRLQAIIEQSNSYVHYRYQEQKHLRTQFLLNEEIKQLQTELNKLKATLPKPTHTAKPTNKPKSQQKQQFVMKKYVQQFETEKREGSYILEQRYVDASSTHKETHKDKEKPKDRQKIDKGGITTQLEYFHNGQIGQTAKPNNDKKQFLSPQVHKKNQAKSPPVSKQPNIFKQNTQGGLTTSDAHPKSPSNVPKASKEQSTKNLQQPNTAKPQNKPKDTVSSPKQAHFLQAHQPKPKGQGSKQAPPSANETKSQKKSPDSKQQKLISTYQKLLEQKDARIAFLQQSLKTSPSRSTKVISTQNINSNNSPSKNVVIRSNRNEYISINNIQTTRQNENKPNQQQQARVETQLATAAKERQQLAQRVQTLENEKSKEKIQQHSRSKLAEKDQQIEMLRENEQSLKKKLVAVQQSLLLTNDMNIALQKQVNELMAAQKPSQKPAQQANLFLSVQGGNQSEQGQRMALASFPSQIQRLKDEVSSLTSQKQGLLARLDECAHQGKAPSQKQSIRVDSNKEQPILSNQQSRYSQKESRDSKMSKNNKSSVIKSNASKQEKRVQAQREMRKQVVSSEKQVPKRNQANNNKNAVVKDDTGSQDVRKSSLHERNSREQLYQLQVRKPSNIEQDILQMKQRQIKQLARQVARLQQQNQNMSALLNETQLRKASQSGSKQPKQSSSITISQQTSKIAQIHRQTEVYAEKMQQMKAAYESLKRELSAADQLAVAAQKKIGLDRERVILPSFTEKQANSPNPSNKPIQYSPLLAERHNERRQEDGRLSQAHQQLQFQVSSLRMQVSALEKQLQQLTHQKEALIQKLQQAALAADSISNGNGGLREQLRRMEDEARQERNNSEALREQLKQAQSSLLSLSKQNASLQNELALLAQKPFSPSFNTKSSKQLLITNKDKQVDIFCNQNMIQLDGNQVQLPHHCQRSQQLTIKITSLQTQLHILQLQITSLTDERLILLARLKELEAALHKQATQMRTFEHMICSYDPQRSLSGISELAQLHQDSEIN